jgi:hypothetical protein
LTQYLPSRTIWHPFSSVKPTLLDQPTVNPKYWRTLTTSLVISLALHGIAAGAFALRSDSSKPNVGFAHSPERLLAKLVLAKPQIIQEPTPSISRPIRNIAEKSVAPQPEAAPPEETVETFPYSPPDSVEEMASVIVVPDLPLPSEPNNSDGHMRIKVFVNENGLADYVELLESNFSDDYAAKLVELFQLARFNPGVSGGKAIKSWRIIEIDYSLS